MIHYRFYCSAYFPHRFDLSPGFQLENVVKKCPLNLTGADFYALSADAMLNAIRRKIDELHAGKLSSESLNEVSMQFVNKM